MLVQGAVEIFWIDLLAQVSDGRINPDLPPSSPSGFTITGSTGCPQESILRTANLLHLNAKTNHAGPLLAFAFYSTKCMKMPDMDLAPAIAGFYSALAVSKQAPSTRIPSVVSWE